MGRKDYGIIGSGPAGYTCALRLAAQGKSVVVFEKDFLGGTCLNKGCIPTKTYLASDNFETALVNKEKNVQLLRRGLENLFKNAKIEVINAEAKIISENEIEANGEKFEFENIIIASGSKPKTIKGLEFDHKFILNSDDILNLEKLPQNILIVGSGVIGIEWSRIFSKFGVNITMIELAENLLPMADIEVSKRIERIFKADGIKFFTSTSVEKLEGKNVTLSNGEILTPEIIFVAVGRDIFDKEKIDGITYLGDVCQEIQLAHYAIHQAMELTDNIPFDKKLVPSIVYGEPEIAWIGVREQDLEPESYQKVSIPVRSLSKAHCDNATEGFIKILAKDNKIIGASIISKEASALIHQLLIAMQFDISIDKLKQVCFAHPTFSEGIYEAVLKL